MAKRGQNEGSIHKRQDGRWMAVLNLGYEDGKRNRKYFYGNARREVQEKLTAALRDQQRGLPAVPERETVGEYLTRWLQDVARHTVRATTFESYERLIRRHLIPHIGRLRLARLGPQDLSRLYGRLLADGLSPRTVQYVHAVIHRALNQALRWNLVVRNVADLVDAPRPKRNEIAPLTSEQASAFLKAAEDDRFYALYVLALTSGMRQAELLGLRWAEVDWERGIVAVR